MSPVNSIIFQEKKHIPYWIRTFHPRIQNNVPRLHQRLEGNVHTLHTGVTEVKVVSGFWCSCVADLHAPHSTHTLPTAFAAFPHTNSPHRPPPAPPSIHATPSHRRKSARTGPRAPRVVTSPPPRSLPRSLLCSYFDTGFAIHETPRGGRRSATAANCAPHRGRTKGTCAPPSKH